MEKEARLHLTAIFSCPLTKIYIKFCLPNIKVGGTGTIVMADWDDPEDDESGGGLAGYSYQTIAIFLFVLIAVFVSMRQDLGGIRTKFLMTFAPDKEKKRPAKGTLYNLLYKLGMNPPGAPAAKVVQGDITSALLEKDRTKNKNKATKIMDAMNRADTWLANHASDKKPSCAHYADSRLKGAFNFEAKGDNASQLLCDQVRYELETNSGGEFWKPAFMTWTKDHGG